MKSRQLKQRFLLHSRRLNNYYGYPQEEAASDKPDAPSTLTIPTRTITETNDIRDDNTRELTCHKYYCI